MGASERPTAAATGTMMVRGCFETLIVTAIAMRTTAVDARQTRMTALDIVLADIATPEAARDALPSHSHTAALFSLTLFICRMRPTPYIEGPSRGRHSSTAESAAADSFQTGCCKHRLSAERAAFATEDGGRIQHLPAR